jgi:hypothetical protein
MAFALTARILLPWSATILGNGWEAGYIDDVKKSLAVVGIWKRGVL